MIYVTGDTHGDITRLSKAALKKLMPGDTLIVCGDFGFLWNGEKPEQKALDALSKRKYRICFIDGTHENFKMLSEYPVKQWNGGNVREIRGNIIHLMRGQYYDIDGTTVFTMGGGESPDLDVRYESASWSRDEIPTQKELAEGADNLEKHDLTADLIITHEPPSKIKGFLTLSDGEPERVSALNAYFDELSASCKFRHWYFGSLHLDKFISSTHIGVYKNILNAETGEKI